MIYTDTSYTQAKKGLPDILQWELRKESSSSYSIKTNVYSFEDIINTSMFLQKYLIPQSSTTSLMKEIYNTLKEIEQAGIHIKHEEEVKEYLQKFPDIMDVLIKASASVKKYFPKAEIVLDIYNDKEIEDRYLIINVRLEEYDESFLERLEKAESEFIKELSNRNGWLQLTTDFGKPQGQDAF